MKYFSFIRNQLALNNNLEKAVNHLLHEKARLVIEESEIEDFKEEIVLQINALNEQYKRCTPIKAYWYKPGHDTSDQDVFLAGFDFCRFCIYSSVN